ncbi:MAG: hypothetical protein PHT40_01000 [Patescibacteria group bacterium]|nr:hypothetical protein [Patescibacteria group bacterium]
MNTVFEYLSYAVNYLNNLGNKDPLSLMWFFFVNGGWIFFVWVIIWGLHQFWLKARSLKYVKSLKWVCLAIDVPKNNEQSPKAVEQIFNQISGYLSGLNWWEKWWKGMFVPAFSFEIVSIGGYVQFVIRVTKNFRDLLEAAVYAQYPDAEISEIEDYTADFTPDNFKEKGWNLWGTQFEMTADELFPIRTYPLFEHMIAQKIIDPLSAMLEMMAKIGPNEQLWFQIVARPTNDDWKKDATKMVKKLIGVKSKEKQEGIDAHVDKTLDKLYTTFGFMFPLHQPEKEEENKFPSNMLYMSKGEIETANSIEIKSTKPGYKTKMRMIYWGKGDDFSRPRGVSPFVGALKQFSWMNGFKPVSKISTKVDFDFTGKKTYKRQRKILNWYKFRSLPGGAKEDGYLLNTEELASLYHFPTIEVFTTAIKSSQSRKVAAPMGVPWELPTEEGEEKKQVGPHVLASSEEKEETKEEKEEKTHSVKVAPPTNLPM